MATSPLPSWGPEAEKGAELLRSPCILGFPNTKRGEKIRSDYLTLAFSGAQKRAELLRNPCILGLPNTKRGEKIRSLSGNPTIAPEGSAEAKVKGAEGAGHNSQLPQPQQQALNSSQ